MGYFWDPVASTGYLSVQPRLRGTGAGVYGWDTGNIVTGSLSGATASHSGTALEYRLEVVFYRNGDNIGFLHGQFETVGENAQLYSVLSTSAGCTALITPGQGGTGNAFPAHGWVA